MAYTTRKIVLGLLLFGILPQRAIAITDATFGGTDLPVAPAPRPVESSETLQECVSRFDSFVYAQYLNSNPRTDREGTVSRDDKGIRHCTARIAGTRVLECSGTDCLSDFGSIQNLDRIDDVCSAEVVYYTSACERRAAELAGEAAPETFVRRFGCQLSQTRCEDFHRFLACEYGAVDRAEELGVATSDGTIDCGTLQLQPER